MPFQPYYIHISSVLNLFSCGNPDYGCKHFAISDKTSNFVVKCLNQAYKKQVDLMILYFYG